MAPLLCQKIEKQVPKNLPSMLYQAYSAKGRNPAVDPKTMFMILTYAYSQNIYSSRKIETACRRDINFMWLLAGQKAPDYSTIARFRTGFLADACENLFYQMVHRLDETGEFNVQIGVDSEYIVAADIFQDRNDVWTYSHWNVFSFT